MSREEAIEILSDMRAEYNLFGDEEEATRYHVLSWAIQAMKDTRRWIPVSERLPEPYQHIIATVRHIGWNEEEYNRVVYMAYGGESNILAWMPLPEPWKGEEDDFTRLKTDEVER